MNRSLTLLTTATLMMMVSFLTPAFAQEEATPPLGGGERYLSAAIAFGAAAIAAGMAIGRAGSAGLAATAERPEMKTVAILITALGEAIGIYGIVIAILILGG